ncbi:hypothetical protein PAXRUDRAFT_146621 [Paxillus rubicundulus Ve08.2h10]|uniref:Uncharacterized protein n=1 Tax=Paxillus rubicundulus Ve08.2h10 TaxID=930991 RepID=A0A0D0DMC6_9AGAM|nr:hypothetical protein PAXRUDRAFT_146621 [Paxillus rubicundulus Ve08.2h10]
MSGSMVNSPVSNFHVPPGTYIAMDAATHTYLNVLNFQGPGGRVVCSVGNQLGNDIWNVMPTENRNLTIQSYGTGDFLSVSGSQVVTNTTIYPWGLIPSTKYPYAFQVEDAKTGKVLRVPTALNGEPVSYEASDEMACTDILHRSHLSTMMMQTQTRRGSSSERNPSQIDESPMACQSGSCGWYQVNSTSTRCMKKRPV